MFKKNLSCKTEHGDYHEEGRGRLFLNVAVVRALWLPAAVCSDKCTRLSEQRSDSLTPGKVSAFNAVIGADLEQTFLLFLFKLNWGFLPFLLLFFFLSLLLVLLLLLALLLAFRRLVNPCKRFGTVWTQVGRFTDLYGKPVFIFVTLFLWYTVCNVHSGKVFLGGTDSLLRTNNTAENRLKVWIWL